jgi:predicted Ser/Thr protein kinase
MAGRDRRATTDFAPDDDILDPSAAPADSSAASARSSGDAAFEAILRQLAEPNDDGPFEGEPLRAGDRIGHFEVVTTLGRGGMGVVYLAEDTSLHRRVALKVLPAATAGDPERRRRLLREARASAAVRHPNIATVHEVGEADGRIFLAMEHVEGESLRARLARGPLGVGEAIAIARQVLEGLAAAHAAGFVHRDLKPENLMLTREGSLKILDFGLAKRSVARPRTARRDELTSLVTREGQVLGTPAYMSPEQAVGDPVDHRSDVFSFGVLLYEMLVGRRPFLGASQVALMTALLGVDPEPPSRARPEIGPALSAVVMRCLAKQAEARWPNAATVARELERASAAALRSRRRKVIATIAAAGVATLGAGLAWKAARSPLRPRADTAPTATAAALGARGAACRVGGDCISGRCAVDTCAPWSGAVVGAGADSTNSVAVTPDGHIVVAGWFRGTIDVGCGSLTAVGAAEMMDMFVARFKREGTCVWSRRFGGPAADAADTVIPAADGHVIVAGTLQGTVDFGGGPLTSRGERDIVLFELDARGNHVWSRSFGGTEIDTANVVRDRDGNLILYGGFTSPSFEIGRTRLLLQSPGYGDGFVAKLSPEGEPIWARAFASPSRSGNEYAFFGATDARGDIALAGIFYDSLDFGGGPLVSAGGADTFLVKLSGADGAQLWARRFGTAADEPYEGAVAFDDAGNLFAVGEHRGADLGGGPLPGTIYVAKLSPSGEHLWSRGFGGESPRDCARRLVIGRDGNPIAFGRFLSPALDFDDRHLENRGGSDLFVARFDSAAGSLLGVETFFATDAPVRAAAIDRRTGNLVVGGRFEGSIDFGAGAHKAFDQDGYYASLGSAP